MSSVPPASLPGVPRRGRFQYSLRSLFGLTILVALVLGLWQAYIGPYRAQERAVRQLSQCGGVITSRPVGPGWLRKLAFGEYLRKVVAIHLEHSRVTDKDLECLRDLPHLERLYLAATNVSDEGLRHVGQVPRLRRLSLWKTSVTDRGIAHLSRLQNLEALDIQWTAVTEDALVHLECWPRLREFPQTIVLSDVGIARLKQFRQIAVPSIRAQHLTDQGAEDLLAFDELRSLELADCCLSHGGLEHLKGLRVESVRMVNTPLSDEVLWAFSRGDGLRQVFLRGTPGISFAGVARAWGGPSPTLIVKNQTVVIPDPVYLDIGVPLADADLAELKRFPKLQYVSIGDSSIGDAALVHLECLTELKELFLTFPTSDEGLEHLGRVKTLEKLHISGIRVPAEKPRQFHVTPTGLRHLQALRQLRNLSLGNVPLCDEHLAFLDCMDQLLGLHFHNVPITGEGFVYLKNLGRLERLTVVDCPCVANDGLVHLRELRNLRVLSLQYTAVTDEGMRHLHGLPSLSNVSVLGSKVSAQARKDLLKSLPAGRNVY